MRARIIGGALLFAALARAGDQEALERAQTAALHDDVDEALRILDGVDGDEAALLTVRVLLASGRVEQARATLEALPTGVGPDLRWVQRVVLGGQPEAVAQADALWFVTGHDVGVARAREAMLGLDGADRDRHVLRWAHRCAAHGRIADALFFLDALQRADDPAMVWSTRALVSAFRGEVDRTREFLEALRRECPEGDLLADTLRVAASAAPSAEASRQWRRDADAAGSGPCRPLMRVIPGFAGVTRAGHDPLA